MTFTGQEGDEGKMIPSNSSSEHSFYYKKKIWSVRGVSTCVSYRITRKIHVVHEKSYMHSSTEGNPCPYKSSLYSVFLSY